MTQPAGAAKQTASTGIEQALSRAQGVLFEITKPPQVEASSDTSCKHIPPHQGALLTLDHMRRLSLQEVSPLNFTGEGSPALSQETGCLCPCAEANVGPLS